MPTKLMCLRPGFVVSALLSLVLIGILPAPAASDPRLLWHNGPNHG